MTLEIVRQIDIPAWVTPDVTELLKLLNDGEHQAMFVGGCVRNHLMGFDVTDIDLATSWPPEEVQALLNEAGVKNIPTGIDHGTITAVLPTQSIEITTLRHDVQTDGRHAITEWTKDWVEDAKRRDFTINTLLMDEAGQIYDPLGCALQDLEKKKIKFVGTPSKRIAEDYLRILRYFRFKSIYGGAEYDQEALDACRDAANKIKSLSRERITQELFKILGSDRCAETLAVMFDHEVLADLKTPSFNQDVLARFVALQNKYNVPHEKGYERILARLFCAQGNKPIFYDEYLRFSKAEQHFYVKLELAFNALFYDSEKNIKKAIFNHGKPLMGQGYLLLIAQGDLKPDSKIFEIFNQWDVPDCPVTGESLLAEGYKTGPELGQELERRREEWMDENF